jgi:hypothetical protein
VQIDKQQIIQLLTQQGDQQKARQAEDELPQQVDTDKPEHQNLLEQLGINPMEIISRLTSGGGFGL